MSADVLVRYIIYKIFELFNTYFLTSSFDFSTFQLSGIVRPYFIENVPHTRRYPTPHPYRKDATARASREDFGGMWCCGASGGIGVSYRIRFAWGGFLLPHPPQVYFGLRPSFSRHDND